MTKNFTLFYFIFSLFIVSATAQTTSTINISGNNTDKSYVSYNENISIPKSKTVDVKMARYCYFSSTITGSGTLNLYGGGERCYLGTAKGESWADFSGFTGNIHIYPFPENSSQAGFYGVVLAQGKKTFSPENVEDAIATGQLNNSMVKSHVTLHEGAVLCCDQNSNGAGFRIGELNTEVGSLIRGYMKDNRPSYFLVGNLGTDATMAGTIAPPSYKDSHLVGLIKEGKGTYRITGNDNYLSGALRVMRGRVLVMNDREEAESKSLRGALGAKSDANDAIAYVFEKGVLGGTGSIGGTVDNYGTIEPGDDAVGILTLKNYATPSKSTNLYVHPASVLRFKIASSSSHDQINVNGEVRYMNMTQDFSTSDEMPLIQIVLEKDAGGLPLFLKKQFLIEVSDYCNSPKSHQSFEDVIISPKEECYGHNLAPFKFDESNNLMRAASVYSLISELPKERAEIVTRQYQLERAQISNDNLMAKITYEVAIDTKYYNILLPEAQAHRNRQLNLHKNDPSWSFIIIYYKPLLQKYNAEQEVIKQKKNIEKEKELDIILSMNTNYL